MSTRTGAVNTLGQIRNIFLAGTVNSDNIVFDLELIIANDLVINIVRYKELHSFDLLLFMLPFNIDSVGHLSDTHKQRVFFDLTLLYHGICESQTKTPAFPNITNGYSKTNAKKILIYSEKAV